MTLETLRQTAHAYAAFGWPVFPLSPGGKRPLYSSPHPPGTGCPGGCGRDGHGVLDATTDHQHIDRWWSRTPTANIGVGCGDTPRGCGPDVVDVDVKDGANGRASYTRLNDAGFLSGRYAVVLTPSGGWHLYFEGTTQGNGTLRGHGVDFRSAGGYVVGAGSVTPAGPYRWHMVPALTGRAVNWQACRDFLQPPRPPLRPEQLRRRFDDTSIVGLAEWVRTQPSGNRNAGLLWACCKALEGGHPVAALEALADAGRDAGLADGEIHKTIMSAQRHKSVNA